MYVRYYLPIQSIFRYVINWVAAQDIKQNFESGQLFSSV